MTRKMHWRRAGGAVGMVLLGLGFAGCARQGAGSIRVGEFAPRALRPGFQGAAIAPEQPLTWADTLPRRSAKQQARTQVNAG